MEAERSWTIRQSEDLGRAIAGVRHAQGLTQEKAARLTAMDRTYLSRLESTRSERLDRALRTLRRMGAEVYVVMNSDDRAS